MALNLLKLCVGVDTIEDLQASIKFRVEQHKLRGLGEISFHITRMVPKRADELLDGGSLYWVIRGTIQARQRIDDIQPFVDPSGVSRCRIVLEPRLFLTEWQPRRAFQGWRYLKQQDAPSDLSEGGAGILSLPPELRRELADLGLL
ncbi:MAG: DUF1489 family protein [Pseudomonadota bacterium]